ncbi:MAG: DUF177 domain-containing protein [Clostridia bacterium]|nr:DUF177 domain-containing protein [Clostridia bacterium]
MVLNMGPLLRGEITRMDIEYDLTPQTVFDVVFPENAHVKGYITDDAGYMRLFLHATLPYVGQCARCLDEVSGVFELDFERTVAAEGSISEEKLAEMDDAYVMIRDGKLDVDEPLGEELLMCFPMRLLCREDCAGLCDKCGQPLRLGDCGCSKKEIDPRLAILQKWVDKQEKE